VDRPSAEGGRFPASYFALGLPIADVLTPTSRDRRVKKSNGVIAREVEATHRLRRWSIATGNDCLSIETDEIFFFRAHRVAIRVLAARRAQP
jgi:hypothetical protein